MMHQSQDKNTSVAIAEISEGIITLMTSIEKLDQEFEAAGSNATGCLREELAQNDRLLDKALKSVDSFIDRCRLQGYSEVLKPAVLLYNHLADVQADLQSVQATVKPDGKKTADWWYKTENLAMSTGRFRQAAEEFRTASQDASFEPVEQFSLKDFVLPAVVGLGAVLLVHSVAGSSNRRRL